MEKFAGIHWRVRNRRHNCGRAAEVCFATGLTIVLLSGCTYVGLDNMRPEINGSNAMVLFPDVIAESASELETGSNTWTASGGSYTPTETPSIAAPVTVAKGETLGSIKQDTVGSSSYIQYLDQKVYQPILEILESSEATGVYFRVFHTGYEPASGDVSTHVSIGSTMDKPKCLGTVNSIAGRPIQEFVYQWLQWLNENDKRISSRKSETLSAISKAAGNAATTDAIWLSNWESFYGTGKLHSQYRAMWHCKSDPPVTLLDYYRAVERDVIGTVPNIQLQVKTGISTKSLVTIDEVQTGTPSFDYRMSTKQLSTIFTRYNQHDDCLRTDTTELRLHDGYSRVFGYVDGFNKTIVLIATDGDQYLQDALGDADYAKIVAIMDSILGCTDVSEIKAIDGMENVQVMSSGLRGLIT